MQPNKIKKHEEKKKALLTFLRQTKDGKFAKIDESSLPYARMKQLREAFEYEYEEDVYYYGTSC